MYVFNIVITICLFSLARKAHISIVEENNISCCGDSQEIQYRFGYKAKYCFLCLFLTCVVSIIKFIIIIESKNQCLSCPVVT